MTTDVFFFCFSLRSVLIFSGMCFVCWIIASEKLGWLIFIYHKMQATKRRRGKGKRKQSFVKRNTKMIFRLNRKSAACILNVIQILKVCLRCVSFCSFACSNRILILYRRRKHIQHLQMVHIEVCLLSRKSTPIDFLWTWWFFFYALLCFTFLVGGCMFVVVVSCSFPIIWKPLRHFLSIWQKKKNRINITLIFLFICQLVLFFSCYFCLLEVTKACKQTAHIEAIRILLFGGRIEKTGGIIKHWNKNKTDENDLRIDEKVKCISQFAAWWSLWLPMFQLVYYFCRVSFF